MKIAVTYENGEVFQHFGHTEQFKLYEVSGGKLLLHIPIVLPEYGNPGSGILFVVLVQQMYRKGPRRIALAADVHPPIPVDGG